MNLYNIFYKRPLTTFIILIGSGFAFGAMTVNIFRLFAANWKFITTYGLVALHEGALRQTIELIMTGMLAMIIFLMFKFCEKILIDRMCAFSFKRRKKTANS